MRSTQRLSECPSFRQTLASQQLTRNSMNFSAELMMELLCKLRLLSQTSQQLLLSNQRKKPTMMPQESCPVTAAPA